MRITSSEEVSAFIFCGCFFIGSLTTLLSADISEDYIIANSLVKWNRRKSMQYILYSLRLHIILE